MSDVEHAAADRIDDGQVHLEYLPPDKLLTVKQVLSLIPLKKQAWLKGVRTGRFPKAVKLSSKAMFWRAGDIRLYIQRLRNADAPSECDVGEDDLSSYDNERRTTMSRSSDALIEETIEGIGVLEHSIISAIVSEGLRVQTENGEPATLAVVDTDGKVVEMGQQVLDEVWNVSILAYRQFLKAEGALRIRASSHGITREQHIK